MDDIPLLVLAGVTVLMLVSSLIDGMGWVISMSAPVGVISAFLSLDRDR
jgi:hypothetical protein